MEAKARRAAVISWEGNSLEVLRSWPKAMREDFGAALFEMQVGRAATLAVRPMSSIAPNVYELKDANDKTWYRMIYLARVEDTIYVLHCFEKDSNKTDKRDLNTAEQRWKRVQQRRREEQRNEKQRQRSKAPLSQPGKRPR